MKLQLLLSTYSAILILVLSNSDPFDLFLIKSVQNRTISEKMCVNLGFDGLGVLSTPEAFNYVLRISETIRKQCDGGFYAGFSFNSHSMDIKWDSDQIIAMDAPWDYKTGNGDFGHVTDDGYMQLSNGTLPRFAVCGNHYQRFLQAQGTSLDGYEVTAVLPNIDNYEMTVPSYLECVMACSHDDKCRIATFKIHHAICKISGPYLNTICVANNATKTFIRNRFQ